MLTELRAALALICILGCRSDKVTGASGEAKPPRAAPAAQAAPPPSEAPPPATLDPDLARDQEEYIQDVMAFAHSTHDQVRERMKKGSNPLKDEWNIWENQGPMTPDRVTAFYKQTTNYIYELAEWHLFVPGKRESDLALFRDLQAKRPKNILDFGGGVGLLAIPLARAGLDVTLADLDSTTLSFAMFRAKRHDVRLKVWKSDVEPAPPDPTYDVIMCMDVLEHLPRDILHDVVDKLVKLKHAGTEIIISAPFGRTAVHPMHMDLSDDTKQQIERLRTALPGQ
ncbi:MAG TPA: methyltransferase domain-containing protein [Kofleriaceae bacterium]|nr:methyltransferase domain-containing protein [Kofleriaceae bacterium]